MGKPEYDLAKLVYVPGTPRYDTPQNGCSGQKDQAKQYSTLQLLRLYTKEKDYGKRVPGSHHGWP